MKTLLLVLSTVVLFAGCGDSDDSYGTAATDAPAPSAAPEPAAVETKAAPVEPAVTLPDGFPGIVHIWPEIHLKSAEVLNADTGQYRVTGAVAKTIDEVTDYYEEYFRDHGWTEDMLMIQEINAVISFRKDGVLQYVEAEIGSIGSKITITTGHV